MLKSLKLTNFRQHQSLEVQFTPGLNTLLGSNEAGKSSLLEAIAYAMLGSDMLRESAAEVVTYDKPLNSLRVDLLLEIDGVDYTIYRTPASAEIKYADQIVTGQRGTKQFVETLLRCDTALFKQLIFAAQESVKGVISSDQKGAAGSLVERLADLQVIGDIIERIQNHLPSGNTKTLVAQLDQLNANLGDEPELPKNEAVLQAQADLDRANAHVENLKPKKASFAADLIAVQQELGRAALVLKSIVTAETRRDELKMQAQPPVHPGISVEDIQAAQLAQHDKAAADRKRKAFAVKFPTCENEWDGTVESLRAELSNTRTSLQGLVQGLATMREERVAIAATAVNEDTCSFCKMDISKLPEVAVQNKKVTDRTEELSKAISEQERCIQAMRVDEAALEEVIDTHNKVLALAGSEFWDVGTKIPAVPVWIGGPIPDDVAVADVGAMQRKLDAYNKAKAQAESAAEQLAKHTIPDDVDTAALSEAEGVIKAELAELDAEFAKRDKIAQAVTMAEAQYANDMKMYEFKVKTRDDCKVQIEALIEDISKAEKHNALIKKLRDTRPAIAAELWTIVLGSVSYHFTRMRGTESLVTRDADGFRVNGRSVAGLSGSTQDALGLAVRVALTRTFLPNVPLLVLDEPFHGCDETRELAGLGLLTSTGFTQTLLVTHSTLADSVSDNLITL